MGYYTQNVDAKLFMGRATTDPLPDPEADEYDEVPLTEIIGVPVIEQTTGGFNVTNDANRRSVGGKLNDQVCEGNLAIDWDEEVHVAMEADCRVVGGRKRNWYIQYPSEANRILRFRGFLSRWAEESFDATGDAKEHVAAYRINVDGGTTPGTMESP